MLDWPTIRPGSFNSPPAMANLEEVDLGRQLAKLTKLLDHPAPPIPIRAAARRQKKHIREGKADTHSQRLPRRLLELGRPNIRFSYRSASRAALA
jgi:hypothetical protein